MHLTPEQQAADPNTPPEQLEYLSISTELARIVASNANATPELLDKLANTKDIFTLQNIAANSNTPSEVLRKLASKRLENMIEDWQQLKINSPFGYGQLNLEEYFAKVNKTRNFTINR